MALVLRIVSNDGKKVFSRVLPALPAHVKVPPDAKIEVIDQATKEKFTLAQYINARAERAASDDSEAPAPRVTVERVADWPQAQAWLDSIGTATAEDTGRGPWYDSPADSNEGHVLGMSQDTLLIGALVGAGIGAGVILLTDNNPPKDTIAPAAPLGLDLATDDDTGTSTTDNITTKTSGLTFSGTAEAGSTVELRQGTAVLGTATAGTNGAFTLDIDLAAGSHVVFATAKDAAGNISAASTPITVTVDTTAPAATGTISLDAQDDSGISSTDGITKVSTGLTISGSGQAGSIVQVMEGDTVRGTVTVPTAGAWEVDLALAAGSHTLTARATDAAGNTSELSNALTIVVDTTAPAAPSMPDLAAEDDTGASNTDDQTTKTSNLTISGSAEAGSTVEIFNGGVSLGTLLVDNNGHYSRDFDFDPGAYLIRVKATDIAGNTSPYSPSLELSILDTQPEAILLVDTLHFG